jgi:hypothetical protein
MILKVAVPRIRNTQSSLVSMALRPCSTLKKGSERLSLALFLGPQDQSFLDGFKEVLLHTALRN